MAQNKFENQIREKLNSREIQPSSPAWDRLDAMLSVGEEKKTKRSFGWLYIAASILVLVTLGMFFFSQKNSEIKPENGVVGTEVKKDTIQKEPNKFTAPIVEKNQENKAVVSNQTTNNKQQITNSNKQAVSIINQKTTDNQIIKDKSNPFQNNQDVAQKDLPKIENRQEIKVNQTENQSDEQLLASLDKISKQSANQKSSVKVDAKSLLSQVDGEVEYTFREKVLTKLDKNYKEVKVALANRNNE